jgi:hypothetical protein
LGGSYGENASSNGYWRYLNGTPTPNYAYSGMNDNVALSASGHLELRGGRGRRIETRWAWNALELERTLAAHGLLLRPLSDEELQGLAEVLAALGAEYAWDFREQRLHDTKALVGYLAPLGLVHADDAAAAVVISDAYLQPANARLRGRELLALVEADDSAWWSGSDNQSTYSWGGSTGSSDQTGAAYAPAMGLGLLLTSSRPWTRVWQGDATARFDAYPYRTLAWGAGTETQSHPVSGALTAKVGCYPSERVSLSLQDQLGGGNARIEHWANSTWVEGYDHLALSNSLSLAFSCQLAYLLTTSLSVGWTSNLEYRWQQDYANGPSDPGWLAYRDHYQSQPYNINSTPSLSFNLTDRLF